MSEKSSSSDNDGLPEGGPQQEDPPPVADPSPAALAAETVLLAVPEFSEAVGVDAEPEITDVEPNVKQDDWNPEKYAAGIQSKLAFRLIWVLSGVLLGGAALFATGKWTGLSPHDTTAFFGVAFGAVVTLTTAATSFWFGTQHERKRHSN